MLKKKRGQKGQSLLEYILILAVVVIAIVAARGIIGERVGSLINGTASGQINTSAQNFTNMTEGPTFPVGGNITNMSVPNLTLP